MIRRSIAASPEAPEGYWLLISQIAHARLSGQLAEHWGAAPVLPLEPREPLLWAIYHHDDGWRRWELQPDLEPTNNQPRAFTEMPLSESLAIWTRSIETARQAGLLQGYVVAGHFCALARRSAAWQKHQAYRSEANEFLWAYEARMSEWLADWQAENSAHSAGKAALAVAQLQCFDALSLWFCCDTSGATETMNVPGGVSLQLIPRADGRVLIDPWPFRAEHLMVEVEGRQIPKAARYTSECLATGGDSIVLYWRLSPARG